MHIRFLAPMIALLAAFPLSAQRPPIIDMHVHALTADAQGPPPLGMCTPFQGLGAWDQQGPYQELFLERLRHPTCGDPIWSPTTDDELRNRTLAVMDRLNVIGVLSGTAELVDAWRSARPDRFIPALEFALEPDNSIARLRALRSAGRLDVLGEITTQYAGVAPDDPRMEPFWALAEELDIPVGIHVGTGPPGVIYLGAEGYRGRLHSALTMEEVLVRHPRLRVYLMHAGYPKIDDLLTVLYAHPQVHVDVGVIVYTQPRAAFYRYLQRIVEAGFEGRILFGSDQMVWPEAIERSVRVIEEAPFLSHAQRRAILYDNAARFLRLTPAQIAAHQQLGRDPAPDVGSLGMSPYTTAIDAVTSYQSCGARARAAEHRILVLELEALERRAVEKGLGATLDRQRQEYRNLLAVSSRMACARGPVAALAGARSALTAFRRWIDDQPNPAARN